LGEWGKLLGLDRAPEVRTLRIKLKNLADQEQAFSWSSALCKEWMLEAPEEAAVLYVDGHVRKHYVAHERLCLSATVDYWGNAMDGKPFFVVSQGMAAFRFRSEPNTRSRGAGWGRGCEGVRGVVQRSYDADFWRQRAEEVRAMAEALALPAAKREMWVIAKAYERLAEHAERTAGRRGTRESP
jgi:hypothetical protein